MVDDRVAFAGVLRVIVSLWRIQKIADLGVVGLRMVGAMLESGMDFAIGGRLILPVELEQVLVVVARAGQIELDTCVEKERRSDGKKKGKELGSLHVQEFRRTTGDWTR